MRFVPVAEFRSRFEAELAAQELEVAGIPFIIRSDDEALFGNGLSSLHGATLLVPEDRFGPALAIVEEGAEDAEEAEGLDGG